MDDNEARIRELLLRARDHQYHAERFASVTATADSSTHRLRAAVTTSSPGCVAQPSRYVRLVLGRRTPARVAALFSASTARADW